VKMVLCESQHLPGSQTLRTPEGGVRARDLGDEDCHPNSTLGQTSILPYDTLLLGFRAVV
jgi:hypothetical protein